MIQGEVKLSRIRAQNKARMDLLGDVVAPTTLRERVPRLGEVAEARAHYKNMVSDMTRLGAFVRSTGFTPGRDFQYVAQIDQAVWSAVLAVFEDELYPPGSKGMNKPFFYALLAGPLKDYDMRGKIVV